MNENIYLMMNKPKGYVCKTVSDWNTPVYTLLPPEYLAITEPCKLHTIGRLDLDTEGLLLFTNDGKLSHNLTIPTNHIDKTYYVELEKEVSATDQQNFIEKCKTGFLIPPEKKGPEFFCKPSTLEWISPSSCILSISEGKFHQVKRMLSALGNTVIYLKKIKMGPVELDKNLKPGEFRPLTKIELDSLINTIYNVSINNNKRQ